MSFNNNKWDQITDELDSESDVEPNYSTQNEQQIVKQHLSDICDTKRRFSDKKNNTHQFIQSIIDINSANHVCIKSLNELNPISIWQLKPNTIHYGYKLIAKIITPPDKLLSIRTIIKDIDKNIVQNGNNMIELSIYNLIPFQVSLSQIEKKKILSKNTIIAIKEPYCKFYKSNKLGIRIDNPYYNLTIINKPKHKYHKHKHTSIHSLKKIGNECFKQEKYWKAILFYSQALKLINTKSNDINLNVKLLLNRSLCYMKLNENNLAYMDAYNAFKIDFKSIKVKYRYLCSLTNIGKHSTAISMINEMDFKKISCKSIEKEFISLQNKINRRHNEWIGKYEEISYKLMSDENKWKCVENYIGDIEIVMINKIKGRGIIAIKDIKCGELILVEKAFSFGSYNNSNNNKQQTFIQTFNQQCKTAYSGRNQQLILNTISKCFPFNYTNYCNDNSHSNNTNNESLQCILNKWRLLQLYDGNENKNKNKNMIINNIEMFKNNDLFATMDEKKMNEIKTEIISAKKVNDIILSNAFETLIKPENILYFLDTNMDTNFDLITNERYCGSGLWIIASLFNHCNNSNAERFVFYKFMFIKAKQNIKKGQEVTISYVDQAISTKDKQNELANWGIYK